MSLKAPSAARREAKRSTETLRKQKRLEQSVRDARVPYQCPACGQPCFRTQIINAHLQRCCPDLVSLAVSESGEGGLNKTCQSLFISIDLSPVQKLLALLRVLELMLPNVSVCICSPEGRQECLMPGVHRLNDDGNQLCMLSMQDWADAACGGDTAIRMLLADASTAEQALQRRSVGHCLARDLSRWNAMGNSASVDNQLGLHLCWRYTPTAPCSRPRCCWANALHCAMQLDLAFRQLDSNGEPLKLGYMELAPLLELPPKRCTVSKQTSAMLAHVWITRQCAMRCLYMSYRFAGVPGYAHVYCGTRA